MLNMLLPLTLRTQVELIRIQPSSKNRVEIRPSRKIGSASWKEPRIPIRPTFFPRYKLIYYQVRTRLVADLGGVDLDLDPGRIAPILIRVELTLIWRRMVLTRIWIFRKNRIRQSRKNLIRQSTKNPDPIVKKARIRQSRRSGSDSRKNTRIRNTALTAPLHATEANYIFFQVITFSFSSSLMVALNRSSVTTSNWDS